MTSLSAFVGDLRKVFNNLVPGFEYWQN